MDKEEEKLNILFTSAGRRGYLIEYFKQELGENGEVFAANSSEISTAFSVADHSVLVPLIYDEGYISFLLNYCRLNDIKAIIPLFDVDLPVLAKNRTKFLDIGVNVIVSEPEVIAICNDKWKTYNFLKKEKMNTAETFVCVIDALKAIKEGRIKYPLIIKPRWGMGSIAIFEAENEDELHILYEKSKQKIMQTYLKYESKESIDEAVLIQEKLIGQEYGLDIINDLEGNYQNTICKQKYAMRSGETDCAVTVENEKLQKAGERLSGILSHRGNLDVDVFMVGGKPYILEMNARFGGGYPFSHMSGVNLPKAIIEWLRGKTVDPSLLKGRLHIMSQKGIYLVRLYPNNNGKN